MGDAVHSGDPGARNDDPQVTWTQRSSEALFVKELHQVLRPVFSSEEVLRRSAPFLPPSLVAGRIECHVQLIRWLGKLAPSGHAELVELVRDDGAELEKLLTLYSIDFSSDVRYQVDPDSPLAVGFDNDLFGANYRFLLALLKLGRVPQGADSQQRPRGVTCAHAHVRTSAQLRPPRTQAHACASALRFAHMPLHADYAHTCRSGVNRAGEMLAPPKRSPHVAWKELHNPHWRSGEKQLAERIVTHLGTIFGAGVYTDAQALRCSASFSPHLRAAGRIAICNATCRSAAGLVSWPRTAIRTLTLCWPMTRPGC